MPRKDSSGASTISGSRAALVDDGRLPPPRRRRSWRFPWRRRWAAAGRYPPRRAGRRSPADDAVRRVRSMSAPRSAQGVQVEVDRARAELVSRRGAGELRLAAARQSSGPRKITEEQHLGASARGGYRQPRRRAVVVDADERRRSAPYGAAEIAEDVHQPQSTSLRFRAVEQLRLTRRQRMRRRDDRQNRVLSRPVRGRRPSRRRRRRLCAIYS